MDNHGRAENVLTQLFAIGVREICICAGARSAPIVDVLEKSSSFRIWRFFDERSAGFFSLGRIRARGEPVVVVMTSGTAVAELLPAVIEAFYQGLELIILSADRPRRYRKTGAPQAIEQTGIFSHYVEIQWDLETQTTLSGIDGWSRRRPVHVNLCLEEPRSLPQKTESIFVESEPLLQKTLVRQDVSSRLFKTRPVAIVSGLAESERPKVLNFLKTSQMPFVAEATAGLLVDEDLQKNRILVPDKTLRRLVSKGECNQIVRLGGIPTLRFWRDLEETYGDLEVLSFGSLPLSGLARVSVGVFDLQRLESLNFVLPESGVDLDCDRQYFSKLQDLLREFPLSEPTFFRKLSDMMTGDDLYLGNSLPIREWDLVAPDQVLGKVWANRGANGIDGQLSSFYGWTAQEGGRAWAVLGDLTTLYDLSAPWIVQQLMPRQRKLVVVNNFGGQIFKGIFGNELLLNRHKTGFEAWAQMWSLRYQLVSRPDEITALDPESAVIELRPDESQTYHFSERWSRV